MFGYTGNTYYSRISTSYDSQRTSDVVEPVLVYINENGDLVIELINLEKNQQVEVLIDTNGTIYKIDKVES
jgi:hypothetical protein